MKKYNVYRNWGSDFFISTDIEQEAWDALGKLRFGEGYLVRDEYGDIRREFVPF